MKRGWHSEMRVLALDAECVPGFARKRPYRSKRDCDGFLFCRRDYVAPRNDMDRNFYNLHYRPQGLSIRGVKFDTVLYL